MKDFQEILAQIALENGTTPADILQEMQTAIDTAYENPTKDEKYVQNTMSFPGDSPTPEEFVSHIAALLYSSIL